MKTPLVECHRLDYNVSVVSYWLIKRSLCELLTWEVVFLPLAALLLLHQVRSTKKLAQKSRISNRRWKIKVQEYVKLSDRKFLPMVRIVTIAQQNPPFFGCF